MHNPNNLADHQFRIFCKSWNGLTKKQKDAISDLATSHHTKYRAVIVNVASASVATITAIVFGGPLQPLGAVVLAALCYFYGLVFGGFLFDLIINIRH